MWLRFLLLADDGFTVKHRMSPITAAGCDRLVSAFVSLPTDAIGQADHGSIVWDELSAFAFR